MSVLLVFLDGIGCGERSGLNPALHTPAQLFATFASGALRDRPVPRGGVALRVDAALGVAGTPQSGTGHTAILTGRNAPALLGMHLWALPNERLREELRKHGAFGSLNAEGYRTRFLNAYRPPFFDWGEDVWTSKTWRRFLSATSWANHYSGNPFYDLDDLRARRTVSHDLTNRNFAEAGFDVPVLTPEEAGAIVAEAATRVDFSMLEHFLTDIVGHKKGFEEAVELLSEVESFLLSLVEHMDLDRDSLLIVSDHGNIEEPQHGRHTRNPAFGMLFGPATELQEQPGDLTDFLPAVRTLLGQSRRPGTSTRRP